MHWSSLGKVLRGRLLTCKGIYIKIESKNSHPGQLCPQQTYGYTPAVAEQARYFLARVRSVSRDETVVAGGINCKTGRGNLLQGYGALGFELFQCSQLSE